jgi:hypothetical protein
MIKYKIGQFLKPKIPNRFWKAFKVLCVIKHDTTLNYEVRCYGHDHVGKIVVRQIPMCHLGMKETSEEITEELFKEIMA